MTSKNRHSKVSKPIPIGMHHTVCGHEAKDLAKRLTDELASQQAHQQGGSLGSQRKNSPEHEPRARSFENRDAKVKSSLVNIEKCFAVFECFIFCLQATTSTIKVYKPLTIKVCILHFNLVVGISLLLGLYC